MKTTLTNHGAEITLPVKHVPEKTYIVTALYERFRAFITDNKLNPRYCVFVNSAMKMHGLRSGNVIILPDEIIFDHEIARWKIRGLTVTHA